MSCATKKDALLFGHPELRMLFVCMLNVIQERMLIFWPMRLVWWCMNVQEVWENHPSHYKLLSLHTFKPH